MRKCLLFILVAGFAISGFSQNRPGEAKLEKRTSEGDEQIYVAPRPMPVIDTDRAVKEDVNRVVIGTAHSQRSVRRPDTHVVYYNPELDVISVTFILDAETYPSQASDAGVTGMFYSEDHGATWQGPVVVSDNTAEGRANYYPSGIVFNPEGNTSVDEAYGITQSTTADWNVKAFGSAMLGSGSFTNYLWEETDPANTHNGYWNQFGLQQINNEVRAVSLGTLGPWANFTEAYVEFVVGELDGDEFAWDFSNSFDIDVELAPDGVILWTGMYGRMDSGVEVCWSKDGEIGYFWMLGVSTEFESGYQPILYRTDDGGDSWDMLEVDFFTDEMQEFFEPYLYIANGTELRIPQFAESIGSVDANGDLQLFAHLGSHFRDCLTYPDSIGWTYAYPGHLFNFTFDEDGLKNQIWIDSLNTRSVYDEEGSYIGSGWEHQLTITKNDMEDQMMYTWCDTRDDINNEFNIEPDIFGWSWNINGPAMESPVCFTEGTLFEKFYYYPYGAEWAFMNDEGNYTVPYIQAITPGEFVSNTSVSEDAITINYVTGIEFEPIFVGLEDVAYKASFEVAQNTPNPFSNFTTVTVNSTVAANVTVEVSSLLGQSVYTANAGTINGTMNINIPAADLQAGVYFYTVTIGSESVTKKMIVE